MRILITGASSFSGAFFVRQLAIAGHQVVTTFQQPLQAYTGVRGQRAQMASEYAEVVEECSFGSERFLQLIADQSFDVLCAHGAWTTNYPSMDYELHKAYVNNTRNVQQVLATMAEKGCNRVVISASIFEGECGLTSSSDIPFSPHGLVKQFTSKTFRLYGNYHGMHVSRFVIPNPFGPLDNPKLIDYLCREWYAGRVPRIRTPIYVRDNIPVELMALAYVYWIEQLPDTKGNSVFAPSGYVGSMADFVKQVAEAMRPRLNLPCAFELGEQTDFSQPMTLINAQPAAPLVSGWDEKNAWDELAEHQKSINANK